MDHEQVNRLLDEWDEARARGEEISPEELCRDCPELLSVVKERIEAIKAMEEKFSPEFGTTAAHPTRSGARQPGKHRPEVSKLGRYQILSELGRGGMGVVYYAYDPKLKREVAIKVLLAGSYAEEEDLNQFVSEAEAVAQIQHPNIVQIYEIAEHDGRPFFVMEFVKGATLSDKLRESPLEASDAVSLVEILSYAMQGAHQKGIIHRDLKPGNVLLDADGSPKLTDFGLAKRLSNGDGTQTEKIRGTPSYMAPEQTLKTSTKITIRTDVYALGAILYECLTGRPPFQGATNWDTLGQVVSDDPVPPRVLQPTVPRDLETICLKCLHKEAEKRYSSAEELAAELQRFRSGEPIKARRVSTLERGCLWLRRHPTRAALIASVTLTLFAAVGLGVGTVYQKQLETVNSRLEGTNNKLKLAKAKLEQSLAQQKRLGRILGQALKAAEEARDGETKAKNELDQLLYFRRVALALVLWKNNDIISARQLLAKCPGKWRHWEWHYVYRVCHLELLNLKGHTEGVTSVAFSPDGKRIVSASGDHTLKMWNTTTGKETLTLKGHTSNVYSVAYSPDGTHIISGGDDKTLRVWDANTGKQQLTLEGHTAAVNSVAYSPDGERIVSGSSDKTVKVWNANTGKVELTFKRHTGGVISVAFSPDGKQIVSGGAGRVFLSGELKVWDAATGKETFAVKGDFWTFLSLAYSPNGQHIVTASADKTLRLFDAISGKMQLTLKGHNGPVWSVAYSPDGTRIVSASGEGNRPGELKVWDANTGKEVLGLKGHINRVFSVAYSPDGKHIASASLNTVKVWDAGAAHESLTLEGYNSFVSSVAFSPNGERIVTGGGGFGRPIELKVWNANKGKQKLALPWGHSEHVSSVAYSPDGKCIVSGSYDTTLKVWNANTGREMFTLKGHTRAVECVAYSPDGKRIVSGDQDWNLIIWDANTGELIHRLERHLAGVTSVAFSPDGKYIVSASADKTVRIWDADTGRLRLNLKGHSNRVTSVAYSPDGKRIVSGSSDKTLKVWEADTGQEIFALKGHIGGVTSVAYSPDGKRIVSGGTDVKVWDTARGIEILTLKGHTGPITSLALSPDGKRLASGSTDKTVKIWNARSGKW